MARFIKLTGERGEPQWVNFDLVTHFSGHTAERSKTTVSFIDTAEWVNVRETPEHILALIEAKP